MAKQTPSAFNLRLLAAGFRNSIRRDENGDDDVDLDRYVYAYNELIKLFTELGRIFSFVSDNIQEKTEILKAHRRSEVWDRYETTNRMFVYERDELSLLQADNRPMISPNGLTNGSRTLLRLHRSLLFGVKLLNGIVESRDADVATIAKKAYDDTLGSQHGWGTRKMVHLALSVLPKKNDLIKLITVSVPARDVDSTLNDVIQSGRRVCLIVQSQLEKHGCLNLP